MLIVGKGESLLQLSPTALRFWDKLGLSPRAGPKDVTAFVFFDGADEESAKCEPKEGGETSRGGSEEGNEEAPADDACEGDSLLTINAH